MRGSGRSHRLPEPLGRLLDGELDRLGGSREGSPGITAVTRCWAESVGETIARNAWPARFSRDGTLVVNATSSTWAFELTQLEQSIRDRLGETAPPRLKFVVGPVPEPGADFGAALHRTAPQPSAAELGEGARIAHQVEASELRTAIARAAAASLARAREPVASADPSGTLQER